MATWVEVRAATEQTWRGNRPNDTMLSFEIDLDGGSRRKMFLRQEVLKPDLEFVFVDSPVGYLNNVDLDTAVRVVGQLVVGALGYVQGDQS